MTAAELYETDGGFRGFIASWVTEMRCPLPLVDYLIERDMLSQAECARWCATEPARKRYTDHVSGNLANMMYPYPRNAGAGWGWYFRVTTLKDADDVPGDMVRRTDGDGKRDGPFLFRVTREKAIVDLLDVWLPG